MHIHTKTNWNFECPKLSGIARFSAFSKTCTLMVNSALRLGYVFSYSPKPPKQYTGVSTLQHLRPTIVPGVVDMSEYRHWFCFIQVGNHLTLMLRHCVNLMLRHTHSWGLIAARNTYSVIIAEAIGWRRTYQTIAACLLFSMALHYCSGRKALISKVTMFRAGPHDSTQVGS